MEIRGTNGLIESVLAQKLAGQQRAQNPNPAAQVQEQSQSRELVRLQTNNFSGGNKNARLIREAEEETDTGFRLVQDFETTDGREFTRIQDFAVTERGFSRDVIQQNPSGSTTRLEEVLNRQDNGLFQRIQRFTNEIGETQTRIDNDFVSRDPFVLSEGNTLGNQPPANQNAQFETVRGLRLDVQV